MYRPHVRSRSALVVTSIALTLVLAAGCRDRAGSPTAPVLASPLARGVGEAPAALLTGLRRREPISERSASFFVSARRGGVGKLPGTGLRLVVPPGAVQEDVTITMTALAGDMLAYEFEPHGLTFAVPVLLEQRLSGTDADSNRGLITRIVGAYFSDRAHLAAQASGLSRVDELEPTEVDGAARKAVVQLPHFSGYIVALGDAPAPVDTTAITY